MKIDGRLSIGFRSGECVNIRIEDKTSGVEFVDATISYEQFTAALSSLQSRPFLECEVRGLEWVGKKRITEKRRIECPLDTHDREKMREWLEVNGQEPGWITSTYLGSQSSVEYNHKNKKNFLNYTVTKFIDSPEHGSQGADHDT